jgi:hypothetical protein
MAQQELSVLRKMAAAAISREFKSHCAQHLPGVLLLLPKRLRSMENVIERIIKRRSEAAHPKTGGPKPVGKRQ